MKILSFATVFDDAGIDETLDVQGCGLMLLSPIIPQNLNLFIDSSPAGIRPQPLTFYKTEIMDRIRVSWDAMLNSATGLTVEQDPVRVLVVDECEEVFPAPNTRRFKLKFAVTETGGDPQAETQIDIPKNAVGVTVAYSADETPASNTEALLATIDPDVEETALIDEAGASALESVDILAEERLTLKYQAHATNDTAFDFYIGFQF